MASGGDLKYLNRYEHGAAWFRYDPPGGFAAGTLHLTRRDRQRETVSPAVPGTFALPLEAGLSYDLVAVARDALGGVIGASNVVAVEASANDGGNLTIRWAADCDDFRWRGYAVSNHAIRHRLEPNRTAHCLVAEVEDHAREHRLVLRNVRVEARAAGMGLSARED